jgi:serine/threonine protein kinase/tetratricopeptide (TPR) repeat protein
MQPRILSPDSQFDPERYPIVRPLGTGGAGAVYLVSDRETGEQLALKKLQRIDQKSVQRFKREFRSLAHVHHPNLIRLYDLGHAPDGWFLTMEYVQGRSLSEELLAAQDIHVTRARRSISANDQGSDQAFVERVIDLFSQLASGVRAIHQAGMLHRDLKPSNVLVAHDGRVVVLDFGLVRGIEADAHSNQVTQDGTISGTPAYMAPEQASAEPLSEASDWYAFGVMLYEMLSGQLPIEGRNVTLLLQRKLREEAQPLADDPSVPSGLRELCMQLLRRDPKARPDGEQVVATLSGLKPEPEPHIRTVTEELVTDIATALASTPLFGRDQELAQLSQALQRTRSFEKIVAHVRGTSGAGKSALVEHFLDAPELAGAHDVLVLRSRCYEREAMPFKALDGVIDALVAHLSTLDLVTTAHMLPTGVADLVRLFPVFERLPVVAQLIGERTKNDDAAEARQRAEQALRDLIVRVANDRQLVVWIDDLQWGDLDSASVIESWLKQRTDAQLLLIFSYRIDEVATSPCLKLLLEPKTSESDTFVIDLTPLSDRSVRELCAERLSTRTSPPPRLVERIVHEARGNPFLAQQLVALALAKQARGESDLENLSMEELVSRTVALLSAEARELLHVLAIAGRPLAPGLALTAAEVVRDGRNHIHALQQLRLVRTRIVGGQRWIEVYHDRVREGVQALLSTSAREQLHARLLSVLERNLPGDPDWLHELAMGAHQVDRALRYGLLAAERASSTLAFERAAELYARCLELNQQSALAGELWVKRAIALARCRRGAEAAEAYLHAAELAEPAQQPALLRFAASHLLRSGRFEEGERLVRRVLDLLDLDVPSSELGLIAAIGWERARIAMRGYEVRPHRDPEVSKRLAQLAELYGTIAVETQQHTPVRAALFQTRALRLALESGDPAIVARGLCLSAALVCLSGTSRAARQSAELFARARELAKQCDSDDVAIEIATGPSLAAVFLGRPLEVIEHSDAANRAYAVKVAGGGHGDYYYWFAVNAARLGALQSLGRHIQARAELRDYLERARTTGNRVAFLQVTLSQTLAERSLDNCATSRARLEAERAELPSGDFGILHLLHMVAMMQAACANGEHDWALAQLETDWPAYLKTMLHGTAYLANIAHLSRARLLFARHVATRSTEDIERIIRPDLRVIASLPATPYRDAALARMRARCAFLKGDRTAAVALLRDSARLLDSGSYLEEPERDRFAIGCLVGGSEGRTISAAAEAKLRELGSLVPREDLRSYYPELVAAGLIT